MTKVVAKNIFHFKEVQNLKDVSIWVLKDDKEVFKIIIQIYLMVIDTIESREIHENSKIFEELKTHL